MTVETMTVRNDPAAHALLRSAHEAGYRFDLLADNTDLEWIRQEIASIVGHRWPVDYTQGDGRYTLTLGPADNHPLGQLVQFHDDPFSSSYRIAGGQITQVNRQMGKVRFSIQTQVRTETRDGRTLPAHFTVTTWDREQGRLIRTTIYHDTYIAVEGTYLPARRRVIEADDNGLTVRELQLSAHQLLEPTEAVDAGT
jgi:hypothetical protein